MTVTDDYIIDAVFCEDCADLRYVRNYPDEQNYSKYTICDGDISDSNCLKRSSYERICAAVDEISQAIGGI